MAAKTRILIADNQSIVRSALRLLLEQQPGMAVVGEASDQAETDALRISTRPDLVLLDWEISGYCVADLITRLHPRTKVIVLCGRPEARRLALQAGADLFVSKGDAPDAVLAAIRAVSPRHKPIRRRASN